MGYVVNGISNSTLYNFKLFAGLKTLDVSTPLGEISSPERMESGISHTAHTKHNVLADRSTKAYLLKA